MPRTITLTSAPAATRAREKSIDELLREEPDDCQVYGHLYEACVGHGCTETDCRIRTCAHCGDEQEG